MPHCNFFLAFNIASCSADFKHPSLDSTYLPRVQATCQDRADMWGQWGQSWQARDSSELRGMLPSWHFHPNETPGGTGAEEWTSAAKETLRVFTAAGLAIWLVVLWSADSVRLNSHPGHTALTSSADRTGDGVLGDPAGLAAAVCLTNDGTYEDTHQLSAYLEQ